MVKRINKGRKQYFMCEACQFAYAAGSLAQKCENWCNKHHSCNIEITKNAVKIK